MNGFEVPERNILTMVGIEGMELHRGGISFNAGEVWGFFGRPAISCAKLQEFYACITILVAALLTVRKSSIAEIECTA